MQGADDSYENVIRRLLDVLVAVLLDWRMGVSFYAEARRQIVTEASTEGSFAPLVELVREPRRCAGKTARGSPCKLYTKNGLYCPYHGKTEFERWNASLAKELLRRRRERFDLAFPRKPSNQQGSMVLRPPVVPPPQRMTNTEVAAAPEALAGIVNLAVYACARVVLWAGLAAAAFVPMLAIGAVGIFVMVFIGAGIEMLSMAAY